MQITYAEYNQVLKSLSKLNEDELCELYWKIRDWQWDEKMGEKPNNFDNLPEYADKWYQLLFRKKSKEYYLKPYRYGIERLVYREKLREFHFIHIEKRSQEDFQRYNEAMKAERGRGDRERVVGEALVSAGLIK